jgi:hypothetical protein
LNVLHHTKQESDRVIVSGHLELPASTEMFNNLKLGEFVLQEFNGSIASALDKLPSEELRDVNI